MTISGVPSTAFSYTFNGASGSLFPGRTGARTGVNEILNGASRSAAYSYDPLYRLTQENIPTGSPSGTITYDSASGYTDTAGFDKVGNRRSRTSSSGISAAVPSVASYSYDYDDRLDNDIFASTPSTYFDANGNTASMDGYTYTYDFENRLVSRGGTPALSSAYDHNGNRVSKTVSGVTTYFLVDEQNPTGYPQIVEELSAIGVNPTVTKIYIYGLLLISQRAPSSNPQYYVHDGHGSVRILLDSSGSVLNSYTYDAFGIQIASSGTTDNRYLYTGEQWDPDLGLYYFRARYYSPHKGRLWSLDPAEGTRQNPLTLNAYLYAGDNPVNNHDPSGEEFEALTSLGMIGGLASFPAISRVAVGRCGPDVTDAVTSTLGMIGGHFASLSPGREKRKACDRIYGFANRGFSKNYAADAWDILELAYYTPRFNYDPFPGQRGSRPMCDHSVTYKGGCYDAGQVNYLMWGKMNRLCHDYFASRTDPSNNGLWSEFTAFNFAFLYKQDLHKNDDWDSVSHYVSEALDFTVLGYRPETAVLPRSPLPLCAASSAKCKQSSFQFTWLPQRVRAFIATPALSP